SCSGFSFKSTACAVAFVCLPVQEVRIIRPLSKPSSYFLCLFTNKLLTLFATTINRNHLDRITN
ncbi:MAG: hypothetical protein OEX07_02570, partial [Gammaproteobacteria bacterium]|nr:hypothetical protein [Gammaproteobacteria bacterium]